MGKIIKFEEKKRLRDLARASASLLATIEWYQNAFRSTFRRVTPLDLEKNVRAPNARNHRDLFGTLAVIEVWAEMILKSWRLEFLDKAEAKILDQAKIDWGEDTTVEIDRDAGAVVVTNEKFMRRRVVDEFSFAAAFRHDDEAADGENPEGA